MIFFLVQYGFEYVLYDALNIWLNYEVLPHIYWPLMHSGDYYRTIYLKCIYR